MKDAFEQFARLCEKSVQHDPFTGERDVEGYAREMRGEIEELLHAIENSDTENLREELGDILLDWLHTALLAQRRYEFSVRDVIGDIQAKLERRKPYISEGRTPSKEEARRVWNEVKAREKGRTQ